MQKNPNYLNSYTRDEDGQEGALPGAGAGDLIGFGWPERRCRKQRGAALGRRYMPASLLPVPIHDREFVIDT
jgi:hypothetical protein